jgi:hypothetical protein
MHKILGIYFLFAYFLYAQNFVRLYAQNSVFENHHKTRRKRAAGHVERRSDVFCDSHASMQLAKKRMLHRACQKAGIAGIRSAAVLAGLTDDQFEVRSRSCRQRRRMQA